MDVVAAIAAVVGVVTAIGLLITESKNLDQVTDDLIDATEEYKKVNDELKDSQDQLTEAEKKQLENRKQLLRADFVRQISKLNRLIQNNSKEISFNQRVLAGLEMSYDDAVNKALEFAATVDEAPKRLQRRVASLKVRVESTKAEIDKLEKSGNKAFDALARGVASGIIAEGDLLTVSKENRAEILRRVKAIQDLEKQQSDSNDKTRESDKKTADNKKFLTDEELERIQELERIKQEIRLRELTGAQEDLARELLDIETEKQAFIEAGLEKELAEKEAQRRLTEFLAKEAEERTKKQEEEYRKQLDFVDSVVDNIAGAFGTLLQIRVDQIKKEGDAQGNLTDAQKRDLTSLALAQKAIAVVTSIIDGIVAVQKNLANPVLAVATGIAAAANTAAIIAQPIPSFQAGGIVGPTPGGRLIRTAENGNPELLLNSGQSGKKFLNEFADAIASRMGQGVTIQQNNMINLGTEEGLRQAARALFPLMEEERLRRGDG